MVNVRGWTWSLQLLVCAYWEIRVNGIPTKTSTNTFGEVHVTRGEHPGEGGQSPPEIGGVTKEPRPKVWGPKAPTLGNFVWGWGHLSGGKIKIWNLFKLLVVYGFSGER